MLVLRLRQLFTIVEAEADERIRSTASDLVAFDTTCRVDGDLDNPNRSVQRSAGEELLEVEGKDVGVVHHRTKD